MVKRSEVTASALSLTYQQQIDLAEFAHFTKWTLPLFAVRSHIDHSTANRRLHKLVNQQMLAIRTGLPLPGGGRQPDLYYPTPLGARVTTRLLGLDNNHYVRPPDVSNPHDNTHDLTALEVAIRTGCFERVAAFEKRTYRLPAGETVAVIPDLWLMIGRDENVEMHIEVEQTDEWEHIRHKYARHVQITRAVRSQRQPAPWLVTAFPTLAIERLLFRVHRRAAQEVARANAGVELFFYSTNLWQLQARGVRSLDRLQSGHVVENSYEPYEVEGLTWCLDDLLDE